MAREKGEVKAIAESVTILEAIDYVGINRFHYGTVITCFLAHFTAILAIFVISYVMKTATVELRMESTQQGTLGGMVFLGMVSGAISWGIAMDTGGRRLTLSVALTCDAIFGFSSSIAATYEFLAFAFLHWVFIKEIKMPPEKKEHTFLKTACYQLQVVFARARLLRTIGLSFISYSVITGYNGILVWLPEIVGRMDNFEKQNPGVVSSVCTELFILKDQNIREEEPTSKSFVDFKDEFPEHIDPKAYIYHLIIGACIVIMSLLGCLIVIFLGKKFTLLIFLIINGCLCVCLAYVPAGLKGFIITMSLLISFGVLTLSANSAITLELYETEVRGMAINIVLMFGRLGSLVSNLIFGHIIDSNCEICFLYVAALLFILATISIFLPSGRDDSQQIPSYVEKVYYRV